MPKVKYGIEDARDNAAMAAAFGGNPLMAGVDPTQYYQDPNDPLVQALALDRPHPIASVGAGIAEAAGKIGAAYLNKRREDKQREAKNAAAGQINEAMAQAMAGAGSPQERFQRGMAVLKDSPNQMLAMRYAPQVWEMVQRAGPQTFTGTLKPGEQAFVNGQQVAATPPNPEKPQTVTLADGVFLLNPDGTRGAKIGNSAREPKNLQTVTLSDGVYILNGDGTKTKIGDAPARERNPKMQTYYDENGVQTQLDSNDPADQKIIKERGLVSESPSDTQRAAKGYLDRMTSAQGNMQRIVDTGFNPGNAADTYKAKVPLIGNAWQSDNSQLYKQAQEDWVRAKLRKESGAVIGKEEMDQEIKTYFPQPGDTAATKAQKEESRRQAERQMATGAGILGRGRLRELDAPKEQDSPQSNVPKINNADDYAKIPSGATYIDPDGHMRQKP